MTFINFAQNKKTYLTVVVGIGLAAYQGYTGHDVPNWIYMILGLAGLGFHRAAITKQAMAISELKDLVTSTLSQLEAPTQAELPPISDTTGSASEKLPEVVDKPVRAPGSLSEANPVKASDVVKQYPSLNTGKGFH